MSKELQDGLKMLAQGGANCFVGQVVDVDKENGICTITADELEYTEVRLSAVVKERNDVFYLFPVSGSYVIVAPISGDIHNLMVLQYSEIENLQLVSGDTELNIDSEGFLIRKSDETLRNLMLDLIKAIRAMKFTTNTGSTIQLINDPVFEALEPRVKNLLKSN